MTLPAIFSGVYDPLPMYTLATICRVNYTPSPARWQLIGNALRTHLQSAPIAAGINPVHPSATVLSLFGHQIVVINGSTDIPSWVHNTLNLLMQSNGAVPPIQVGLSFWQQSQALASVLAANGLNFGGPVILVGHSLGGAIACCLANQWLSIGGGKQLVTVTFGCPRVGNDQFYFGMTGNHARCVYNRDLVTQIPQNGVWLDDSLNPVATRITPYTHGGTALWIDGKDATIRRVPNSPLSGGQLFYTFAGQFNFNQQRTFVGQTVAAATDHNLWNYVQAWRANVQDAPRFVLESLDQCNDDINASTGESWQPESIVEWGFAQAFPSSRKIPLNSCLSPRSRRPTIPRRLSLRQPGRQPGIRRSNGPIESEGGFSGPF